VLNAHPPDPKHPQTPERIAPGIRRCVAFFKCISAGAFRARDLACVHHVDQLVLREMDKIGYRLGRVIEGHGHWAFQTAAQETVWEMKNASYGYLSTRHVAIEAGLGTIGLELNLLAPECGPRCYTTVVMTDAELEPDGKMTAQLCIGEPCSRCLYSCLGSAAPSSLEITIRSPYANDVALSSCTTFSVASEEGSRHNGPGPCRSRACPVDYPVRGGVRNPDDSDDAAGGPRGRRLGSCPAPTARGCGRFGLGLRRVDEETSAPWEARRDRCGEGQRAGVKRPSPEPSH
jgi:hypothetical protein